MLAFLERRLPWLGTPGLLRAVVMLNALMFLVLLAEPGYRSMLDLNMPAVFAGEVWRLVTYIFIPETESAFWILFFLLFMWFLATSLEEIWGAFRLNLFYLTGMLGCTLAAAFFGGSPANTFLNLSLFFAFATLVPDYEIWLLFLVRVKVKWVALFFAGFLLLQFVAVGLAAKGAMAVSLINYALFFGPAWLRQRAQQHKDRARRSAWEQSSVPEDSSLHRCGVCGRTDLSHPELDFRVAADGQEYCLDHLPSRSA